MKKGEGDGLGYMGWSRRGTESLYRPSRFPIKCLLLIMYSRRVSNDGDIFLRRKGKPVGKRGNLKEGFRSLFEVLLKREHA